MRRIGILLLTVVLLCGLCGCFTVDSDWRPVYSDVSDDESGGLFLPTDTSGCASSTATTGTATVTETTTTATITTDTAATTKESAKTEDSSSASETTTTEKATETTTAVSTTSTDTATSKTTTTTTATTTTNTTTTTTATPSPEVDSEFRAAWVSYVELDELLCNNKTPQKAKEAIDALMSDLKSYHLNTVIWIARANSDAYYDSDYFKPSTCVKPLLDAGFDPLAYAIAAAHERGLEFHVWVNPYRIGRTIDNAVCDDYFYYDGKYYYIPTSSEAQTWILNGIRELVNNYDVDGLHFDDYFYPKGCAEENERADFESATAEPIAGQTWGDLRRNTVNALVRAAYAICHSREGCVFGISPPNNRDETYSQAYADPLVWLSQSGYVDYLCPQVYFGFEHRSSAFDKVVDRWLGYDRSDDVALYFGIASYKAGLKNDEWAGSGSAEWIENDDILKREVEFLRSRPQVDGMAFFSYSYFNPEVKLASNTDYDLETAKKEVQNLLSVLR